MNYEQASYAIRAEINRLEDEHGIDEAFAVTYLLLQAQTAMRKARSALDRLEARKEAA